jgi:hypothetical protein
VTLAVPFMRDLFKFSALSWSEIIIGITAAIIGAALCESVKFWSRPGAAAGKGTRQD